MLMSMQAENKSIKQNLESLGVKDKDDQTYQTAIIARMIQKALVDGDTNAAKFLAEITGEVGNKGFLNLADDPEANETIDMYKSVYIPNNGRNGYETDYLTPQPGPQTMFMCSPADIIIYGGAAGGGKTFALLMEGLRHKNVVGFSGVIFVRIILKLQLQVVCGMLLKRFMDLYRELTPKRHLNYIGISHLVMQG